MYYSAIFLCYVFQSRRGRWREGEREREREQPSNSAGVPIHWTVQFDLCEWLFLAQSNSLLSVSVVLRDKRSKVFFLVSEVIMRCVKGSELAACLRL